MNYDFLLGMTFLGATQDTCCISGWRGFSFWFFKKLLPGIAFKEKSREISHF